MLLFVPAINIFSFFCVMQSKQFINSSITSKLEKIGFKRNEERNDEETYIARLCCSRSLGVKFKFPFEFASYNHMTTVAIRATEIELNENQSVFF